MPVFSDAVGLERRSRVLGYKIGKDDSIVATPNLPMRIAVLCEMNSSNQGDDTSPPTDMTVPFRATSAAAVGKKFGWGSPAHIIDRILHPQSGGLVGGIPVYYYTQEEAVGASAAEDTILVEGTATANVTHTVLICGRGFLEGGSYDINISKGDTEDEVAEKMQTAISSVLGCPVTAALNSPPDNEVNTTSKWKGLTAEGITISVETYGKPSGLTYTVTRTGNGAGTPDINPALDLFGNTWNTIVINSYGTVESVMDKLELFNGIADPETPSGRFTGTIMRPFIALTGSVDDDPSDITDARLDDMTIAICPAPLSPGLAMEAAASMCEYFCRIVQDTPHLDVQGRSYRDMPVATEAIAMSDYNNRDAFLKKGCSTVDIVAGKYQVQDFVTTYHPVGEEPPQFAYCRNIMIDLNCYYTYFLLEQVYVVDHVLAKDTDAVSAPKVIKPKEWKGILGGKQYALALVDRALISDAAYLVASLQVGISTSNPDRMATRFKYKRTSYARILDTTAEAGFNLGE